MSVRANVFASALAFLWSPACAADATGFPRILDGDKVEVGTAKIRLNGIDAPEAEQVCLDASATSWPCGLVARERLKQTFGQFPWSCKHLEVDRYGRSIADCFADGQNVSRWMVRKGWALAFVRYSRAYEPEERAAKADGNGLWAGSFIAPWDWRAGESAIVLGLTQAPPAKRSVLTRADGSAGAPSPACTIKGNRRQDGECIYHLPGGRWYAKVDMSGPRKSWFCSATEAEAAGCRAAKN